MRRRAIKKLAGDVQVMAYADYRDYLAELYSRAKDGTTPYSYEMFAEDLGFSAINTIRLVIVRKRLLSDKSAQTIAKTLGLHRESRRYFLAMVGYVNARSPRVRSEQFQKMLEAKQASLLSHREKDQFAFLSEWYHWAVLEMLRLDGLEPHADSLSERLYPPVSVDRIRRSLALLEAIGLVERDDRSGQLRPVQESPMLVPSDEAAAHLVMTRFHQSMLETAKLAVDRVPENERDFNALTVSLSREGFEKVKGRIRQLCSEILEIEQQDQTRECVAQINLNLFALTKSKRGDS